LHASFKNVFYTKLLRDIGEIARFALIALRGRAGNHFEIGDLGQPVEDLLLYPIGEICVLRISTEIFEW
jgi:hypothetical protein